MTDRGEAKGHAALAYKLLGHVIDHSQQLVDLIEAVQRRAAALSNEGLAALRATERLLLATGREMPGGLTPAMLRMENLVEQATATGLTAEVIRAVAAEFQNTVREIDSTI